MSKIDVWENRNITMTSKLVIQDEVISTFIWLPRHGCVHGPTLAKNQPHNAESYFARFSLLHGVCEKYNFAKYCILCHRVEGMSRALLAAGGGLASLGLGLFLSSPPPKDTREHVAPRTAVVIGGGVTHYRNLSKLGSSRPSAAGP